jgi:hypothetical protein
MPEVISRRRVFGLLGVATLALAAPAVRRQEIENPAVRKGKLMP